MLTSATSTALVTNTTEVDVTKVVAHRLIAKKQSREEPVPSYIAIILKALAMVLLKFPYLNASIDGQEIILWDTVNIGIAIETPRGLLVPVIREVQNNTITSITREIEDLASAATQGKLLPDQLQGGTFTLTNLGAFDVEFFSPIINYPQAAILGIGKIKNVLFLNSGQMSEKKVLYFSLSYDHRVIDGAPATRFIQDIKRLIKDPSYLLNH